ncbi:MAG: tRNA (adenosine(37)-N6)-threonylcarbamoyltransferase complex transferase subunit TsaD [Acidobacteriota bacterium]|nr:MAG: tRNA (adenosine(37)-N6)-threonylcarbamoyltransferase complex transferase subunit TsaD [Acidobacteriota bacterium]
MVNILGIETSCDETAAAVLDGEGRVCSSIVSSQIELHAPYGGIVPEIAARQHLEAIEPVIDRALERAGRRLSDIGGIAVTCGPGLIGCLLVGTAFARSLALARRLPVVGVNHLEGHVVSGWIDRPKLAYPALALVVSGGHTGLWRVPEPGRYVLLARTRDDAAGEALDKVGKLLGLAYPGGPAIDRLGERGDPQAVRFGEVRIKDGPAFSFSGYKTAVRVYLEKTGLAPLTDPEQDPPQQMLDLIASFRCAVVRELVRQTRRAIEEQRPASLVLAGGVAASQLLRREISTLSEDFALAPSIPELRYCGDNAAMIALAGRRRLLAGDDEIDRLETAASLPLGGPEARRRSKRHR